MIDEQARAIVITYFHERAFALPSDDWLDRAARLTARLIARYGRLRIVKINERGRPSWVSDERQSLHERRNDRERQIRAAERRRRLAATRAPSR